MSTPSSLLPLLQRHIESDPAGAARNLEALTADEAAAAIAALPPSVAARTIPHLQVSYSATVLAAVDAKDSASIFRSLEPERAATVFMHLARETREALLPLLPDKLKLRLHELLTYPEGSVGRIMRTAFFAFRQDTRVQTAIKKIRKLARKQVPASYLYVVDAEERLVGVMNMYEMLLAPEDATFASLMRTKIFSIHCFTDCEEAALELAKRKYFAAPVVDHENRLLGIIKAEQLFKGVQEEVTEDIQRMVGAGSDERAFSPVLFSLRKRLPWLHVNLGTAFLAASVVAYFEDVVARVTVLAVFLPIVAGQGGNAGAQSLAIVMRGLVMREIPRKRVARLILKEAFLGTVTGAITGTVTGLLAWGWYGNRYLGLVVGLGMVINLFAAGLAGAAIPLGMKALRLDPAQCSTIILTTVTDVVGFLAFLGLAVLFLERLV
jgi:magnesium transporter